MNNKQHRRRLERTSLILVTVVLSLGFFILYGNMKKQFELTEKGYKDGSVVNLTKEVNPTALANVLLVGNYVSDKKDAGFIAQHLAKKLQTTPLLNLGTLNLNAFKVAADSAFKYGGNGLHERVESSRENLRVSHTGQLEYGGNGITKSFSGGSKDNCSLSVRVEQPNKRANWFQQHVLHKTSVPSKSVVVELKEHYYDSLQTACDSVVGYALTGANGKASFTGLKNDGYYSVLPIKQGFEYGSPKGTVQKALGKMSASNRKFSFTQQEHTISPFDASTYSQIKDDNIFTVRTPKQFENSSIAYIVLFMLGWWFLHIFFCIRKKDTDQLLAPVLMALSGIGLLMMYSTANPLVDTLLGNEMVKGAIFGIILIAVITEIDFVKFFNSHYQWFGWLRKLTEFQYKKFPDLQFDFFLQFLFWMAKPFTEKVKQIKVKGKLNVFNTVFFYVRFSVFLALLPIELLLRAIRTLYKHLPPNLQRIKLTEGSGYLILALTLASLLFPFGDGPEGSGVKVNLLFFQPSEITKYLIIFFVSSFFVLNKRAEKLQAFSEKMSSKSFSLQARTVVGVILGLVILLGFYLALGDMGPALVLTISFIIIYSVARRDTQYLFLGTAIFAAMLFGGYKLSHGSQLVTAGVSVLWLAGWLAYGYLKPRKQLFESAIFLNLVIAAFIFGSNLPKVGQRLQERNDIYANVWDNEVNGGDQLVQGLWSLASGGLSGQGLGEGNPNLVAAYHTDMMLTSIGEELGLIGLLFVIACMAILLHRSLLIARRAGNPFAFYLATGIAVVTAVQFLVIASGCIGLIPLTGVAVPFLSYGKTSLIINLAAFGILFSISQIRAKQTQAIYQEIYKYTVLYSSLAYFAASLIVLAFLARYQLFERSETLVRPAFSSDKQGARFVEYNPRINLIMKQIYAGNIYDRNGLLLATNEKELLEKPEIRKKIQNAGIHKQDIETEVQKRKKRYYPFGDNLFFMVGDYNTSVLWNDDNDNPHGYLAERRHLAALRGFNNLKYDGGGETNKVVLTAKKYKPSPFIHPIEKTFKYSDYDYSALAPILEEGIGGSRLKEWNDMRKTRDIALTIDASLQTKMQNGLRGYALANFNNRSYNKLRISVVVLNAKSGELLCSANYPLPNQDRLKNAPFVYDEKDKNEKAYTDRDLGLTFQTAPGSTAKVMSAIAGLLKLGKAAASKTYFVDPRETIETDIEPSNYRVTMEDAIVKSSNCYFVNLVNDQNLYPELDSIYSTVGIRIDKHITRKQNGTSRIFFKSLTPYFLNYEPATEEYKSEIRSAGENATRIYRDYVEKRSRNSVFEKMSGYNKVSGHEWNECAWAWGQGTLRATPLNMARITSIVANDGRLAPTHYVLKGNENLKIPKAKPITVLSSADAQILKEYMTTESMQEQRSRNGVSFNRSIGGKTGTPERELHFTLFDPTGKPRTNKKGKLVTENLTTNDGWYIFFTNSPTPLAVAVRMERLFGKGSGEAVRLTDRVVLRTLEEAGYFK
jgi:cell division protein FtsW (lipid II flippase)/cell division protein FtsI/penicillin-binding protein 2